MSQDFSVGASESLRDHSSRGVKCGASHALSGHSLSSDAQNRPDGSTGTRDPEIKYCSQSKSTEFIEDVLQNGRQDLDGVIRGNLNGNMPDYYDVYSLKEHRTLK